MSQEEVSKIVNYINNVRVELVKLETPSSKALEKIFNHIQELSNKNRFIQVIRENAYCTERQVKLAAALALKAHTEDLAIAKNPAMEFLLYLSATRQIKEAIELVGARPKENACIVLASYSSRELEYLKENLWKILSNIQEPFSKCLPDLKRIKELYDIDLSEDVNDLELTMLTKIALTILK